MEQKEKRENRKEKTGKKTGKKMVLCGIILLALLGTAGGFFYYKMYAGRGTEQNQRPEMPENGNGEGQEYVTASGATVIGITEETFEISGLDTELEIEEVYLKSGDTVEEGTKILKVSEDSLSQARKELIRKAEQTKLLYRQGVLQQELSLIEAKSAYDVTITESEYIQSDYENSLEEAYQEVDELTKQVEEAKELYDEYYDGVYNDGYAEEYELAEKKALYEQNEELYWDTLKAWNIKDTEVNNSSAGQQEMGSGTGNAQSGGGGNSAAAADKSQRITALELMEDTYRAEKEDYEQALADYESAVAKAEAGLEQAKAEYELLTLKLEQAQIDYEKQAAVCLADYETKMAAFSGAQNTYDSTVEKLSDELETLENDREEAEENLSAFEEAIGDGYLYTGSKGNVMMVSVKAGEELPSDTVVLAYSDPTVMTVTAAVAQQDIAALSIGEEAVVVTEENGNFAAEIAEINPVSNSNSRASVTYTVTLVFTQEAEELSENETVSVCFGINVEEYESMANQVQMQPKPDEGGLMPGGNS